MYFGKKKLPTLNYQYCWTPFLAPENAIFNFIIFHCISLYFIVFHCISLYCIIHFRFLYYYLTQILMSCLHSFSSGELGPKIYFNHNCFTGPFLSKGRISELPESVGPGHIRLLVKEMLTLLISVGYKSSYILKILEKSSERNPDFHPQLIKTK